MEDYPEEHLHQRWKGELQKLGIWSFSFSADSVLRILYRVISRLPLEGETNTGHSSVSGICAPRLHLCAKYTRVACSSCSHYYRFHDSNDILFWISLDSFTFTPCSIADCI